SRGRSERLEECDISRFLRCQAISRNGDRSKFGVRYSDQSPGRVEAVVGTAADPLRLGVPPPRPSGSPGRLLTCTRSPHIRLHFAVGSCLKIAGPVHCLGREVPVVRQLITGRRSVQGCASSRVRDTRSRRSSRHGAATIWTPTGRPVASSWWIGTEIAGWPVTLNSDVNTAIG